MHVCGSMGKKKHRKFNDKKAVNHRSQVTIFLIFYIFKAEFAAKWGYI